jgi:hypothetical protein
MLRTASKGDYACCGPSDDPKDPTNDPAQADHWGAERQIRAILLRYLCTVHEAANDVHHSGIFLLGAKIIGWLNLAFVNVPYPLTLRHCRFTDSVCLIGSRIPVLDLVGSSVKYMMAEGATFLHTLFLCGFAADEGVRLARSQIGGDLACTGGKFGRAPTSRGEALNAESAQVAGHAFLNDGFAAEGEVWLLGIKVGGDLNCAGGTFKSLSADYANIKRSVFLNKQFTIAGTVRLPCAQIGGSVMLDGGKFGELYLQNATIGENLFLDEIQITEGMTIDLRNASADTLCDDPESWPTRGKLHLNGFLYRHISSGTKATSAKMRLEWLGRQGEFRGQPYRQLAKVLREMGDDRGARLVGFQMESRRRRHEDHTWRSRIAGWVLKATIGYGVYPLRVVWWLLGLTIFGAALFHYAYQAGAMTPAGQTAYVYFQQHHEPPPYEKQFNCVVYSLENSVPVLRLGQDSNWTPDPAARNSARVPWWLTVPSLLRCFRWTQIIIGWILGTLFVAGVTGVVRKE